MEKIFNNRPKPAMEVNYTGVKVIDGEELLEAIVTYKGNALAIHEPTHSELRQSVSEAFVLIFNFTEPAIQS